MDCGKQISKKAKRCHSCASSGEYNGFYGKKHTRKTRIKMSKNHADISGKKNPMKKLKIRQKISNLLKEKPKSKEHKKSLSVAQLKRKERDGYINSPKTRKKMGFTHKKIWEDPSSIYNSKEYKEKQLRAVMKALQKRPTKLEQKFINFFKQNNIPFKYNYNGIIQIGYKIPDFTYNPQKLVVEVGNKSEKSISRKGRTYKTWQGYEQQRIKHFVKYNYGCLCLWEDELENPNQIINKIKEFLK